MSRAITSEFATLARADRYAPSPGAVVAEIERIRATMLTERGAAFTEAFFDAHSFRVGTDGKLRPHELTAVERAEHERSRRGGPTVRGKVAAMRALADRIVREDHDAATACLNTLKRKYNYRPFTA